MERWVNIKTVLLAFLSRTGAAVAEALGGWDGLLETLVWCMAVDYITGVLAAGVFRRSPKSRDGALDSRVGFRGLCKKGAELGLVLLAAKLDGALGGGFSRTAVLLFLIANEGLSVLENLGLMGVPYPVFLREALEVLRERNEQGPSDGEE